MHSHQLSDMAQDTAPLPSTSMLDAPRTPTPSPESLAALAQFMREVPSMHAVEIRGKGERTGSHARALYIPPMTNYSRTPGEGELLLGCCTLLVMAILVVGACYYFLVH